MYGSKSSHFHQLESRVRMLASTAAHLPSLATRMGVGRDENPSSIALRVLSLATPLHLADGHFPALDFLCVPGLLDGCVLAACVRKSQQASCGLRERFECHKRQR